MCIYRELPFVHVFIRGSAFDLTIVLARSDQKANCGRGRDNRLQITCEVSTLVERKVRGEYIPRWLPSALCVLIALAANCGAVAKSQVIKPENLQKRGTALCGRRSPLNFLVSQSSNAN